MPTPASPPPFLRRLKDGLGQVLVTLGLVMALFAAYETWGKAAAVGAHQRDLDQVLAQQWTEPPVPKPARTTPAAPTAPAKPKHGAAVARLSIPKLGMHWVVVEGVNQKDIRYGPGHYPDSAMPGEIGNFAVAGHRVRGIFWDLDQIKPKDLIIVETRTATYTYRVTKQIIVKPTAVEVVAPVPSHPGEAPKDQWLTLTTCNPKWDNYQRLVIHAILDHTDLRTSATKG
jgi:sortase A